MSKRHIEILADRIEREFLPFVRKPARYTAGEINQIKKDLSTCELSIALCFPDVYEVAMSNLGIAIIYDILNKLDCVVAERVFSPWLDAEKVLRQKQIPLFSLESKASLRNFDIIAFSLTNEMCCTNVLNMLDLAGLNIRSSLRTENDPLIIAGGSMANCCEPMADFIDLFVLGEGEEAAPQLAALIKTAKQTGLSKNEILLNATRQFDWAYVPRLYGFDYEQGKIKSFYSNVPDLPVRFRNAIVADLDNAPVPTRPIVPFVQAVHERVSIEIMRGCPGRCRFCQASFCRRPIRHRSIEKIIELAKACYNSTGFDTIGLLSLSSADYPEIEKLLADLHTYFHDKHVGLSIPSLRVDQQLKLLPELLTSVRKGGLTIAVEAASEKLRQIINKPLKDEDLFAAVDAAYRAGWQKLKLYFMVGLPGETTDNIKAIVDLSYRLATLRKTIDNKTGQINITVSWFVPKPHTPFAWLTQKPKVYFEQAKQLILAEKRRLNAKFLQFKFHDINRSVLESAIGRGGRNLAEVVETAWRNGARFDLWDECFDHKLWQDTFAACGIDLDSTAQKQFAPDEILPWEHLGGPDKKYLLDHLTKAVEQVKGIENLELRM